MAMPQVFFTTTLSIGAVSLAYWAVKLKGSGAVHDIHFVSPGVTLSLHFGTADRTWSRSISASVSSRLLFVSASLVYTSISPI